MADIYIQPLVPDTNGRFFGFGRDSKNQLKASYGLHFLAQRILLNLLTAKGTDPLDPNRGTDLAAIVGSNYSDEDELAQVTALAVLQTETYIKAVQADEEFLTADERLGHLAVTGIDTLGDFLQLSFTVQSEASTSAKLSLVVPT